MKFSTKLAAFFSVTFIVAGAAVSYFTYLSSSRILQRHIEERLEDRAFHTMDKMDLLLFERNADMRALANDPVIRSRSSTDEEITGKLNLFKTAYGHYIDLALFDLNRRRLADTSGQNIGKRHAFSEYWPAIAAGRRSYMVMSFSDSAGRIVVYFAAAVKDMRGIPFRVVVSKMPVENIYTITSQAAGIGQAEKNLRIDLVDKDGILLYSSYNKTGILKEISPDWEFVRPRLSSGSRSGSMRYTNPEEGIGEEILVFARERGYLDFKGNDWTIIGFIPTSAAFASAMEMRNSLIAIFLSFAAVGSILLFFLSKRMTRPVDVLSRAALDMGRGNLDVKVTIDSRDEMGHLAEAFNKMAADLRAYRDRLLSYNDELAARVAERTAELKDANRKLQVELEERRRTQDELKEKEERLHTITDTAQDAITMIDDEGKISFWNPAAAKIFGYNSSEALGQELHTLLGPQRYLDAYRKGFETFRKTGQGSAVGRTLELEAVRKGGEEFPVELSLSAIQIRSKWHAVGMIRDISERKSAERSLRESEERLKTVVETVQTGILIIDPERHTIVDANLAAEKMIRTTKERLIGSECYKFICPAEKGRCPITELSQPVDNSERLLLTEDGEQRQIIKTVVPVVLDGKKRLLESFVDISELKRAEQEILKLNEDLERRVSERTAELTAALKSLKSNEEKLKTVFNTAGDGILLADVETGKFKDANDTICRMLGYSYEEITSLEVRDIHREEDLDYVLGEFQGLMRREKAIAVDIPLKRKDGSVFYVDINASPITLEGRQYLMGVFRDVTERKRSEEDIRTKARLLDSALDSIFLIDMDGNFLYVNEAAWKTRGYTRDELMRMNLHDLDDPHYEKKIEARFKEIMERGESIFESAHVRNDGSVMPVEIHCRVVDVEGQKLLLSVIRDITERKHAEEQLMEAQEELVRKEKLSILGQLAGSVGHELRNPLGVISNAVYFLKTVMPDGPEKVVEYLNIINNEVNTSHRIISDLLDFSRTKMPQTVSVAPADVMAKVLKQCAIPEGIRVGMDIPDSLPLVRVDPLQMGQVFQNLIMNAVQAMPGGGLLHISACLVSGPECEKLALDPKEETSLPDSYPGCVEMSFSDTGEGISPENMKKLFQPLFTTKAKGIGLGLFVCRKLTEANGGAITVETEQGKGTTFRILVPAARQG